MKKGILKYEVLNEILLPLAEQYEAGNPNGLPLAPANVDDSQAFKECLAELGSEGWLTPCRQLDHYKLTRDGYVHFEPRLHALRTMKDAIAEPLQSMRA
jgi:hypothetical protein